VHASSTDIPSRYPVGLPNAVTDVDQQADRLQAGEVVVVHAIGLVETVYTLPVTQSCEASYGPSASQVYSLHAHPPKLSSFHGI
jgi:hypothetical protein